jgi:hypothetical protein
VSPEPERDPIEVHITSSSIAIPVWVGGRDFEQIVVEVEQGQRKTIEVHGRRITVIRDYLQ